jgi:hypothetical protein
MPLRSHRKHRPSGLRTQSWRRGNQSALRLFRQLALTASRCLFPVKTMPFSNAYGHRYFWSDYWLGKIYTLGQEHNDPLLHLRSHQLEVSDDRKKFLLSPGYSAPIPAGDAIGAGGRSRPWSDLPTDLAEYGLEVDVLEPRVFRASAYAIERIMNRDCLGERGSAPPQPPADAPPDGEPGTTSRDTPGRPEADFPTTGYHSPADIAKMAGLGQGAIKQLLRRWRIRRPGDKGCVENKDRGPNQPQYLYNPDAWRPIVREMLAKQRHTEPRANVGPRKQFPPSARKPPHILRRTNVFSPHASHLLPQNPRHGSVSDRSAR